jgi:uncharacterized membrane protein YdbT with pleckstrin-like domain
VAFPEDILTDDEEVVLHVHPHWRELVRPVAVLVLGVPLAVAGWFLPPDTDPGRLAGYALVGLVVVLMLWLSLWPWLRWRTTHYLFTNERVVLQHGVVHRQRRDIPLHRVNNHLMSQRLVDRFFGCGTLIIESAGQEGRTELVDVPRVQQVQTMLYDLVDADRDRYSMGDQQFREIMEELSEDGT